MFHPARFIWILALFLVCLPRLFAATVTDQWKSAASGDWTNAANWAGNGQYPNNDASNSYTALIAVTGSPYTITINNSAGISVGSLNISSANATLNLTGGTFSSTGGFTLAKGTFNLGGGTLSGGTFTINSGAVFNVTGWGYALNTIVNNGTIGIASGNELELKGGTILNAGYINISNNASFPREPIDTYTGFDAVTNTGTIVYNSTSTGGVYHVLNNNSGTLLINTGTTFFGNDNLNFSGNSYIGGAGTFSYSALSFVAGLGNFVNSGTLLFNSAHTELYGNTTNNGKMTFVNPTDFQQGGLLGSGSYNLTSTASATFGASDQYNHILGSTLNNAGTLSVAPGHYVQFSNGTLTNSGTLNLLSNGTMVTAFTLYDPAAANNLFTNTGTLSVSEQSTFNIPFANSGTILLNTAHLYVSGGGTFSGNTYLSGFGGVNFGPGTTTNSTTLSFVPTLQFSLNNGTFNNTGTLNITGVSSSTLASGTSSLINSGTISLIDGDFYLAYDTANGANYTANSGTLLLNGGNYNDIAHSLSFTGNSSVGGTGYMYASYGAINNASSSTLTLAMTRLQAENSQLTNGGTIIIAGNVGLLSEDVKGAGTLIINRGSALVYDGSGTSISNTVINNGTITVESGYSLSLSAATLLNNYYVNLNYGSNSFSLGSGTQGSSLFQNNGTLTLTAQNSAYTVAPVQVPFQNNGGTIVLNSGTLQLGAATASFSGISAVSGAGTLEIATGRVSNFSVLTLSSNVNQKSGTFSSSGTAYINGRYDLNGGTLNNDGTLFNYNVLSINGGTFINGGLLTSSGTFIVNGGTFTSDSATQVNGPLIFNGGLIGGSGTIYSAATFSVGTLSTPPTLSARLVNNGTLALTNSNATLALADGTLTNNRTMRLTSTNGGATPLITSTGYSAVVNNGTLTTNTSSGSISLTGVPLTNNGTLIVNNGGLLLDGNLAQFNGGTLNGGTWVINATGSLNLSNNKALTANAATVYLNNAAKFSALTSITRNSGTISLAANAVFAVPDGFTNTGTIVINNSTFTKAATLTNNGTINGYISNGGTLTLGNNSFTSIIAGSGTTLVSAGANATVTDMSFQYGLTIGVGGTLNIGAGGGTLGTAMVVNNFDFSAANARFNLNDHDFIATYPSAPSLLPAVTAALKTGYNGGQWNGPGIDSATAAGAGKALGVAVASDVLGGSSVFSGRSVSGSSVLVKYTYSGDANLDGKVDVVDLGMLASHWQQSGGWYQGDFNYDGKIDVVDLGVLASDWQLGTTGPQLSFTDALKRFDFTTPVPEPAMMSVFSLALLGFARKRTARRTPRSSRTSASALPASGRSAA